MMVLAWVLLILGAAIAFLLPSFIKNKEFESDEKKTKCIYIMKIIGMWIVIIGAFLIFRENGRFGIR